MNHLLKNILAVISGLIGGSVVNMALVSAGPMLIPPPEGADITTMEGLKQSMHLFEPKHFIFPWLAHALGTMSGALLAALISANKKLLVAMLVGVLFLVGGVLNVVMLPSPLWFTISDLLMAYLPMAFLGYLVSMKIRA